jgi:sigma-E factor negative regulatory protein RseA
MSEERPQNQAGDRQVERDSQLSAMFDGELPAAECELLARRLVRDEALRALWSRYALIGGALRAERGVALHDRVAWRVQSAIIQEASYGDSATVDNAVPAAARAAAVTQASGISRADRWMRYARPVFGAGIAAGVAAMSILWMRTPESPDASLLASSAAPTAVVATPAVGASTVALNPAPVAARQSVAGGGETERFSSTPAPSSQTNLAPPARLANYVVAHSEYSGPLSRRMALLGLVASEGPADAGSAADSATMNTGAGNDAR